MTPSQISRLKVAVALLFVGIGATGFMVADALEAMGFGQVMSWTGGLMFSLVIGYYVGSDGE